MNALLLSALVGLARATEGNEDKLNESTFLLITSALLADETDAETENLLYTRLREEKKRLVPDCFFCTASCGRNEDYDVSNLENNSADIREMKIQILSNAREIAKCGKAAALPFLCRSLYAIGRDDWSREDLQEIINEAGLH